jgi:hypothetical protein
MSKKKVIIVRASKADKLGKDHEELSQQLVQDLKNLGEEYIESVEIIIHDSGYGDIFYKIADDVDLVIFLTQKNSDDARMLSKNYPKTTVILLTASIPADAVIILNKNILHFDGALKAIFHSTVL